MPVSFLFINPDFLESAKHIRDVPAGNYNEAIASISASLKASGHAVTLYQQTYMPEREEFLHKVRSFSPDIIGFTVRTTILNAVRVMAGWLDDELPDIPVIIGGYHPTLAPQECIEVRGVDAVCVGEGELVTRDLIDAFAATGKLGPKADSFWFKQEDGAVVKNPVRPYPENLDELPFPDLDIFDFPNLKTSRLNEAVAIVSRGCMYSCTYCANVHMRNVYENKKNYARFRSPENAVRLLQTIIDKDPRIQRLNFNDSILNMYADWFYEFMALYKERIGRKFTCNLRFDHMDEKMVKVLADSGCYLVTIGLENGNEEFRQKYLHRSMKNDHIVKVAGWLLREGIMVYTYNIVALPHETLELTLQTIKLNARINATNVIVSIFYPYPATALRQIAEDGGFINPKAKVSDKMQLKMPQYKKSDILYAKHSFLTLIKKYKKLYAIQDKEKAERKIAAMDRRILSPLFPRRLIRYVRAAKHHTIVAAKRAGQIVIPAVYKKMRMRKYKMKASAILAACLLALGALGTASGAGAPYEVNVTVDTVSAGLPISPYIYGLNGVDSRLTQYSARQGGNRLTGYNWHNNYSNAGSDWQHYSDDYLLGGIAEADRQTPGIVMLDFARKAAGAGAYSVVTLPMAGFVARDGALTVTREETAPSERWAQVIDRKPGGEYTLTPDPAAEYVYSDELLRYLVATLGDSSTDTGVKGYCLDNEPGLWSQTHPRIHPDKVTVDELAERSISLAAAVKDVDPGAEVYGPVLYGFNAYNTLQDAPDWHATYSAQYEWFIDCYLDKMREAEEAQGRRLLDVLDLHYYSEAQSESGSRVVFGAVGDEDMQRARVQSTRSLHEYGYVEKSWIGQWFSRFLPIIPKVKQSIEQYYPGTKLAFTEYSFGAEDHISGAVALADTLGIFAEQEVYLATLWPTSSRGAIDYALAALNMYTNADGAGSAFGDTLLRAANDNAETGSVYASADGEGNIRLMVINKDTSNEARFNIGGIPAEYTLSRLFVLDGSGAAIREETDLAGVSHTAFTVQPMSIYHLLLAENTDVAEPPPSASPSASPEASPEASPSGGDGGETGSGSNRALYIGLAAGGIAVCALLGAGAALAKKGVFKRKGG
ncbi:MAG: cobalamin-dependent protein [Oscillospiraceae bacterium]|jgi:mannan endo-1,4-beta-mannosidase|nr:cobalamin-dependent protein [Oscillospiraceae bacterium]